jgi:hypothetical protein
MNTLFKNRSGPCSLPTDYKDSHRGYGGCNWKWNNYQWSAFIGISLFWIGIGFFFLLMKYLDQIKFLHGVALGD